MGKIRLLPDEVASQVAAGEVVERPASVVKELVENAVDAGAARIAVDFARGGTRRILVSDDGCGMDREDALLCLERHATSKIRNADDLARVGTMGFRGEAVPSIASVSRLRISTRPHDAEVGTEIVISGGKIESVVDSGSAPGTVVEVGSLFFNVPARRKFLRSEETETAHILSQMQGLALAHPDVGMSVSREGRPLWQAAATDDLAIRIRDVLGQDFLSRLHRLEPDSEENEIQLSGFLARPGEGRPDREMQFVVLNGRIIHCPAIFQALGEAYSAFQPKGRHPFAVLSVSMDPLAFDCNVHPAKREIRLHRPDVVRQLVYGTARRFLERLTSPASPPVLAVARAEPVATHPHPNPSTGMPEPIRVLPEPQAALFNTSATASEEPSGFRLIGGLGTHWILMESSEGLVLLDVRAASERILFETLKRESALGSPRSQALLLPEVVELTPTDAAWISENIGALSMAGFHVEPFGGSSFKIDALPACLAGRDSKTAILELCQTLRATGAREPGQPALDLLIRSVSRLAALDRLDYEETRARRLVRELLACDLPYACPQGRPTMIQWSYPELDRKFGRS